MTGLRTRPGTGRGRSVALIVAKVVYWLVFALSLVIVVGYWHFTRPPTVTREEPVPSPVAASDDPATPQDESLLPPSMPPEEQGRAYKDQCYTFLVMGMDAGNGNTDTMMVVTYDVPGKHVGVVSVPRDTLMDVPRTVKKVNAAYASGGVEEVKAELSGMLGFPLDYYIIIDLRGFKALVDTMGGVDFDVPVNMNYDDPTQDLHIHLNKGMQHLNGAQALQLVRFRSGYANADIGRIQTQQKFLVALVKKLVSWNSVSKINDFVDIFAENVKTDLSVRELGYFALSILDLDLNTGVSLGTLPGDGTVTYKGIPYYYQLDPAATLELLNQLGMSPYEDPLTHEDLNIFQAK